MAEFKSIIDRLILMNTRRKPLHTAQSTTAKRKAGIE